VSSSKYYLPRDRRNDDLLCDVQSTAPRCKYMNVRELDRKLIKSSTLRVVKCGNILEKYEYAIPYFYNFGKSKVHEREAKEAVDGSRTDNIERARRKIKRLINSNVFQFGYHPIFVTYTFAENVTDVRIANRVFKEHHDRLRRRVVGRSLRYIAVPEFQKRGAVHYHVIYFDLPYIAGIKQIFAESWGKGFVQVKAISHVVNVGAYVSKYFQKQWHERKARGEKCYFSSVNLFQPETYHQEQAVDLLSKYGTVHAEHTQEFISEKYGLIKYTQLKIL
jgi:hypothetical protein